METERLIWMNPFKAPLKEGEARKSATIFGVAFFPIRLTQEYLEMRGVHFSAGPLKKRP